MEPEDGHPAGGGARPSGRVDVHAKDPHTKRAGESGQAHTGMAVDDAPGRAPATAGRGETAAADTGTHPSIKIASAIPAMARI